MARLELRVCSFLLALTASAGCKSSSATSSTGSPTDSGPAPITDASSQGGGSLVDSGAYDFSAVDAEEFGGSWKTDGLVILVGGQVVYEKYGAAWTATMPHILYSVSKSIGATLVGLAINDGLMHLTDSICTYVPDPEDGSTNFCSTTIQNLMQMGSGIAWNESYSDPNGNVLQMLYGDQSDMGAYVAQQGRGADAGSVFNYSSGDANLLSLAFKNALKGQDPRAYAQTKLWAPTGITSAIWEEDPSGTMVFSTDAFLTTRDLAKFGQLYLANGMAGGAQVLPASFVAAAVAPAPFVSTPQSRVLDAGPAPGGSYGYSWWLNAATPTATSDTWEYPDEPVDGYQAEGHYGQELMVVPSRQLVVARVGSDQTTTYVPNAMIGLIVAAVDAVNDGGSK